MALIVRRLATRASSSTPRVLSTVHVPSHDLKRDDAALSPATRVQNLISQNNTAIRQFHSTPERENAVLLGGLGVAAAAIGTKYLIQAWEAYKAKPKSETPVVSTWKYRNFYDGPFEDKMTRREAALILGVRESASTERIRNAHRKLLILNHPDTGGSTFIATKINQAKELLLSGQK